jgi:tungstate transport system ATP-binding protein
VTAPAVLLRDVLVQSDGNPIVRASHFAIHAGETVALVGPNGAGKTTLLHVAALLRPPDVGSVAIFGEVANGTNVARLRRALSVVFQDPLLFDVSVLANAAAGVRFKGRSQDDAERQARHWLARFGVEHLATRKPRGISGGEAARVALARAFATEPSVLLLDEPFSALDGPTRSALLPELRSRVEETGAAAVLVTHDLDEAFAFARRIDLMEGGEIIASGPVADLVARPPSRRAAELIGVENCFDAQVSEVASGCVSLVLQPHGPVIRARQRATDRLLPGQPVTVTIPAGAIALAGSVGAWSWSDNRLEGVVSAVTPLPLGRRLMVETPAPFVVLAPWLVQANDVGVGDRVEIAFGAEAVHVMSEG